MLYRETMHRSDRLPAREFSTSSGKQPQFPSGKFPFFQYSSFFRRTLEGLNSIILESPSILATRRGFLAPLGNSTRPLSSATLPPFLATYLEFRATLNSRDFSPFSRHENTSQPCNCGCGTFIAGRVKFHEPASPCKTEGREARRGKDPISSVSLIVSLGRE